MDHGADPESREKGLQLRIRAGAGTVRQRPGTGARSGGNPPNVAFGLRHRASIADADRP